MVENELKFLATPEKGEVSALLVRPAHATHLLVLGHGASTTMRHATLQAIAAAMAEADIASLRYNLPTPVNIRKSSDATSLVTEDSIPRPRRLRGTISRRISQRGQFFPQSLRRQLEELPE